VIELFRANVLFTSFEFHGPADKSLVYLTLFVTLVLKKYSTCPNLDAAKKLSRDLQTPNFPMHGEHGFPLGGMINAPESATEGKNWKVYMQQARGELALRLLPLCFNEDGSPNKWWLQFAKRKFMNKTMPA